MQSATTPSSAERVRAEAHVRGGSVRADASVHGGPVRCSASANVVVSAGRVYDGDCTAVPCCEDVVYQTRDMLMPDDFTVLAIALHESPNGSGTTITIGG